MSRQENPHSNENKLPVDPTSIPDLLKELEQLEPRSEFRNPDIDPETSQTINSVLRSQEQGTAMIKGTGLDIPPPTEKITDQEEVIKPKKDRLVDIVTGLDWIKIVGGICTCIIGLRVSSEVNFNTALSQINDPDVGKRNTGIIEISKAFEGCRSFSTNEFFPSVICAINSILANQNEKQWKIIKTLDNSIRTRYPAPNPLNIDEKIREKKYSVGTDLQNALDILAKEKLLSINKSPETIVLKESNLYNAQLINAKLSGTDFNRSYLYLVNLKNADLKNAHFNGAYLRSVTLTGANLTGADLTNADLHSAFMKGAIFSNEQIIKSCHWSKARYDEEQLSRLPAKNSDKSIKKSECNNGVVKTKPTRRKHLPKNNLINEKPATVALSSRRIKNRHDSTKNDQIIKKATPIQSSSNKSKYHNNPVKNNRANKKSVPSKLSSNKLKRHHNSAKNDRKKIK
jgi:Pentapeptide repeats (8 copies)